MRNFVQSGNTIPVTAPAGGVLSGAPVRSGNFFGVAAFDAAASTTVEIALTGVFDLPKKAADVAAVGALLYWDNAAGKVTITSAGNVLIGAATAAAAGADATVRVRLNGVAV